MSASQPIDQILGQNHRIVVLDTFVIRELCHAKTPPAWHATFVNARNAGISFLVSAYSTVELHNQFEEGRVASNELIAGAALADQFLEPRLRICPVQRDLSYLAGVVQTHDWTIAQIVKFYNDIWDRLSKATIVSGAKLTAGQALEDMRSHHRALIKKFKGMTVTGKLDRDALKGNVRSTLENQLQLAPQIVKDRFEPLISLYCHFLEASLAAQEPYNEESDRRRNDGIDLLLFSSLYFNAYLITEERWANVAKAKGDGKWDERILTIGGFVDKFQNNQLSWV